MQVFDELKARGVETVFFISMDGVSGLEEGAKALFPSVIVQPCMGSSCSKGIVLYSKQGL